MFKFSLGSFGAFLIFADLLRVLSQKWLIIERNGAKFGPQVQVFSVYRILLTVSVQVQFGVIRCISDIRRPSTCFISETANRRAKRSKIWASGVSI